MVCCDLYFQNVFESKNHFTLLVKATEVDAILQTFELIEDAKDKNIVLLRCTPRFVIRLHKCSLNMLSNYVLSFNHLSFCLKVKWKSPEKEHTIPICCLM